MTNGFDYITLFREYLETQEFYWLDDDFYEGLCEIDCELVKWLLAYTNNLRITE